ncbi:dihydroneopterin triphosphate diphosphatase [Beggiatoa leptomitoformis]|uniref:Dihydroneopterin triphosphate diphosphatase n=1 Tax=Beggiatoa leptomitoformis TaxID=288004 RepID=A0A2N9YG80_9GAMM|nr:dihydroneopterin triphosphate diphosphatase [Beggiatoa leptomitoformis]ALG68192.1 dihydroneopterin triphosphate diphosphatase [Beggiatoa leptomitoformis]AUI69504.1 dihydroneopterin triphosphate diphosphatase [Beggiatoa leptomitoformis]
MFYKRPESILLVIHTIAGKVLLLERADIAHFWQSVTGSLQADEIPIQTAQRELAEETGLHVDIAQLHNCHHTNRYPIIPPWRSRYAPTDTHNIEHVFTLCLTKTCPIQLNPQEHLTYGWFTRDQALQKVSSSTNRLAIEQRVKIT